jgi:hypothetical protein
MHDAVSHLLNLGDGVFPGFRAGQNLQPSRHAALLPLSPPFGKTVTSNFPETALLGSALYW